MMEKFIIVPLSKDYAASIRKKGKDDFGHDVIIQTATGLGPCRVSLKPFRPGIDKRMLFSYSPFDLENPYNQPGPVFIMADEVEEYAEVHRFPSEIKADKKHFHLTLIGYTADQMMIYTKLVGDADIDELIVKIFHDHPEVEYIHARSAEAACYICRIERSN